MEPAEDAKTERSQVNKIGLTCKWKVLLFTVVCIKLLFK